MITFVTLLLGLVLGPQPVELAVAEEVAGVELWLDGRRVVDVTGPPWETVVDFGDELVPHELVAVARDEEGRELQRVRRFVNVPREVVEARIVLDPASPNEPRSAEVVWEAVDLEPESWSVTLDGEALRVSDLSRFELPDYDPEEIHFLSAVLRFPDAVSARAEASFGGVYADRVATELTAVALSQHGEDKLRGPEDLAGWFRAGDREVPVVALDRRPPANVVLVIDPAAREALRRLAGFIGPGRRRAVLQRLGLDDRAIYLQPSAERVAGQRQVFDTFQPLVYSLAEQRMDFVQVVTSALGAPHNLEHTPRRLADAVAVAGLLAAHDRRSRAVVLVVGAEGGDSRVLPEQARDFLAALGVPLFVWRAARRKDVKEGLPELSDWPDARLLARSRDFRDRIEEVRRSLDAQRIVWLDGKYLRREIELTAAARRQVEWLQ